MQPTQVTGFRLSPQQRHVWQMQRDSRSYRAQISVLIEGPLDQEKLEQALLTVAERHQILRTVLRRSPGVRFPIQVIEEGLAPGWRRLDYTDRDGADQAAATRKLFESERKKPFDLERGPNLQAVIAALAVEKHLLLLGLPTLLADEVSLDLVVREVAAAYGSAIGDEGEEAVQYVQFSEWQNEMVESEDAKPGRDFWQGLEQPALYSLKLPVVSETSTGVFTPERVPMVLDPEVATKAAALGDPEAVFLALWTALLWRLTGEGEGGVGVISAGRHHEELAATPGLFARCLPLPWKLSAQDSFRDLIAAVEEQLGEARDWQDFFLPGEIGSIGVPTCFQFDSWEDLPAAQGLSLTIEDKCCFHQRFEVCLSVQQGGGSLSAALLYDSSRISAEAARTLARRAERMLHAVLENAQGAIGDVDLLTEEEEKQLRAFNQTAVDFSSAGPVHEEFVAQAARTPDHVALEFGDQEMNYAELDRRSNRLAHHLAAGGIGPDTVVGVCLERSLEMVVGVLGILKAGGAYLPLEPTDPPERLAFMVTDAEAALVLTRHELTETLAAAGVAQQQLLCLDTGWQELEKASDANFEAAVSLENLAYVLYTSGSTGRPKGVAIAHRGLINYLRWAAAFYRVAEGKGTPMHAPLGFDLTVTSLFTPLLVGNRVIVLPEDQGVRALGDLLAQRQELSLVKVTPAHLALVARPTSDAEAADRIGTLIIGGEALYEESLRAWREQAPGTRLINEYGPTETVVGCAVYEASAAPPAPGAVPIGRPIANTRIYLLGSRLRPVPVGVVGELCVGGAGLARGYHGLAQLSAQRFVPDPFAETEEGGRLYRTGDLARFLPSGDLEFLGRNDHQVKVRGFRIELGEIEAVLSDHPAIREAAVLARQDTQGEVRLVAYLVAAGDSAPNVDELRRFLTERLPEYMLPAAFVEMDALPLTARGKLDRGALPEPGSGRPELEQEYVAPRDALEESLAEIMCEVLGLDQVGVHDSFFALGGDSIRSVQVVALARERGLEITVELLFQRLTIANLAEDISAVITNPEEEAAEEASLAQLISEMENLSDDEIQARLEKELAAAEHDDE